jgi:dihydrodipicolinate synthase/N-acetylneuraminate lyase
MKDSHRETRDFVALQRATRDRIRVFVAAWQFHGYEPLGAAGLWSYDCWMGPEPLVRLRDAMRDGRHDEGADITLDLYPPREQVPSLSWRETAAKLAVAHAGYVQPGPLRPPFVVIPPEVDRAAQDRAARWQAARVRYGAAPAMAATESKDGAAPLAPAASSATPDRA